MDIQKIQQLLDRCAGEMTGRASFYFQDLATGESAVYANVILQKGVVKNG